MRKNVIKIIIWIVCLCLLIYALGLTFYLYKNLVDKNNDEAIASDVTAVSVIKPQSQNIEMTHSYIGKVEAINKTSILPYISGYVISIEAEGGQKVKKGDILAVLQQEQYLAALASASARLFSNQAEYYNNKIKYERMLQAGDKVISPTDLDDAKASYLSSLGNLQEAKAAYLSAQTDFAYTYLRAPFDGVLGNIDLSLGEYISPQSSGLMQLVQYDPIRVVFSVTDKEFLNNFLPQNKDSVQIKVKLANGEILPQSGEIKYFANEVEPQTGSVAVYAEFANPDAKLLPHAYVQIMLLRSLQNVVLLPKTMLLLKSEGEYVYTVKDGVLGLKEIAVMGYQNDNAVISNDFMPDEYIVDEAFEKSRLGQKVNINLHTSGK